MSILTFLVSFMSAAMLLLFGVSLVRAGVERKWGPTIRDWISVDRTKFSLLGIGATAALIMQGGTAVVLMIAGLATSGTLPIVSAATIAIGAELGSALVLIFLNFPITGLSPVLLFFGGAAYLWGKDPSRRAAGKIGLGLGLIFLSLIQIKANAAPFRDLSALNQVADYLNNDLIAAALLGMVLTAIMHSSVAALLTAIAFATSGVFGVGFGFAFALGANIGSALIPMWLLRVSQNEQDAGWAIARGVGKLRIGSAVVFLALLLSLPVDIATYTQLAPPTAIIVAHLAFNTMMLFATLALPYVLFLDGDKADDPKIGDEFVYSDPEMQRLQFKKRVLSMLDELTLLMDATFSDPPKETEKDIARAALNTTLSDLRGEFSKQISLDCEAKIEFDRQMDFAIRIERSGSVLSTRFFNNRLKNTRFSKDGGAEIGRLEAHVRGTMLLAHEVLATGQTSAARLLVQRKQMGAEAERTSRENHFCRLRRGDQASLASSDEHLDAISSLKEVNSKLCTIAYAILEREGALKKTRLKSSPKAERSAT